MSVIGPRPLLVEYLPYYTKEEHHRHDVKAFCLINISRIIPKVRIILQPLFIHAKYKMIINMKATQCHIQMNV